MRTPRQRTEALLILAAYAPAVFDTVLGAVEPFDETADPRRRCGCRTAQYAGSASGSSRRPAQDWRHYRGEDPGGPFEIVTPTC